MIKEDLQPRKYFFLAVNTGYVENESPTTRHIEFHSERSANGLYCTIVGNVLTPAGNGTNAVCARISDAYGWRTLAREINAAGAKAGIQLSSTWSNYSGSKNFINKNPEAAIEEYKNTAKNFSIDNINHFFTDLERGSNIAIDAGFQHVQLHAAHGYLFNLLLDPFFSIHHTAVTEKTFKWIEKLKSQEIETSIRISIATGIKEIDVNDDRLSPMITLPCDFIDLSQGLYNINKQIIYPSSPGRIAERWRINIQTANKYSHRRFICSGHLNSFLTPEVEIPPNIDYGICRDLIANPNFMKNQTDGCEGKMKCHYYSRGTNALSCGKWSAPKIDKS